MEVERTGAGFMSRPMSERIMNHAKEYHEGKRKLPCQIVEKKKQIADAMRNAELFVARLRLVDEGMVNDIVRMRRELDGLYLQWSESGD